MTSGELFDACREAGLFHAATDREYTMPVMRFMQTVARLAHSAIEEVGVMPTDISLGGYGDLFTRDAFESGQKVWKLSLPERKYLLFSEGEEPKFLEGLPLFPADFFRNDTLVAGDKRWSFNAFMKSI